MAISAFSQMQNRRRPLTHHGGYDGNGGYVSYPFIYVCVVQRNLHPRRTGNIPAIPAKSGATLLFHSERNGILGVQLAGRQVQALGDLALM